MNASSIQTSWKLLGEVENAVNWFGPAEIRRGPLCISDLKGLWKHFPADGK